MRDWRGRRKSGAGNLGSPHLRRRGILPLPHLRLAHRGLGDWMPSVAEFGAARTCLAIDGQARQ
jgi:hypothetical protein